MIWGCCLRNSPFSFLQGAYAAPRWAGRRLSRPSLRWGLIDAFFKKAWQKSRMQSHQLALVRSVFPAELHEALNRFDIPKLTELVAYLMFGDPENDDQPKKEGKAAEKN